VLHALAKDKFDRFQTAAEFRQDLEAAGAGEVPIRKSLAANDFNATLFGANPNTTARSEATMRQLAAQDGDRPVRTQTRPPVAWIWVGITAIAVILIAVVFWVVNLPPASISQGLSVKVPAVVGEKYDTAVPKLTDAKLVPSRIDEASTTVPQGQIISTDPTAGTKVSKGQEVKIYVSAGKNPTTVPSLNNLAEEAAKAAIKDRKLVYGKSSPEHSPTIPAGTVVRSEPAANTAAREGDTVNLFVSDGLINIPSVIGQDVAAAIGQLVALQLNPSTQPNAGCTGGKVTGQSVTGDNQPQHSPISITYCSG
jgi:serine/threonine-protein kinase